MQCLTVHAIRPRAQLSGSESDGKAIISECRMVSKRFYVQTGDQTERLLEWNTWHEIYHHESFIWVINMSHNFYFTWPYCILISTSKSCRMTRVVCLTWAFVNVIFKTIVENPLMNNFINHNAQMFVSNPFQQINRFETNILTAYPFKPADNTIPIIVAFVDALTSKIGLKWI